MHIDLDKMYLEWKADPYAQLTFGAYVTGRLGISRATADELLTLWMKETQAATASPDPICHRWPLPGAASQETCIQCVRNNLHGGCPYAQETTTPRQRPSHYETVIAAYLGAITKWIEDGYPHADIWHRVSLELHALSGNDPRGKA